MVLAGAGLNGAQAAEDKRAWESQVAEYEDQIAASHAQAASAAELEWARPLLADAIAADEAAAHRAVADKTNQASGSGSSSVSEARFRHRQR